MEKSEPVRMFSYSGECFICVVDLLRWLDVVLGNTDLSPVRKQTYAWVQWNFDQIRLHQHAEEISTIERFGLLLVSCSQLKTWCRRHTQVNDEEWSAIHDVWLQLNKLEDAQASLDLLKPEPDAEHVQIFKDLMHPELINSCIKFGIQIHLHEGRLRAKYLHKKDFATVIKGEDVRGAIKNVIVRISSDPTTRHFIQAQEELGLKRPDPELPFEKLLLPTLD